MYAELDKRHGVWRDHLPIIPPTSNRVESQSDSGPERSLSEIIEIYKDVNNTRIAA